MTIFDVQRFSVHDGPGIRTTAFLKGCHLRCLWCQNPEGLEFDASDPAGSGKVRQVTPAELADELLADQVFFETSGGGVTFSGGEPLAQAEGLVQTARLLRTRGVHVAVETALEVPQTWLEMVLDEVDLVLADVKAADSGDHQRWTGRGNERVLGSFKLLADYARQHGHPAVVARTPLVPGHTATEANLRAIGGFLAPWRPAVAWELLDFNPLARSKYAALGRTDYAFDTLTKGLPAGELERLRLAADVSPSLPQELSPS
jgi:pyruvate formate lyase activating enzyme